MTLTIRRAGAKDGAAIARLMGDPSVVAGTLQLPFPSDEFWQERMTQASAGTGGERVLVAERDGEIVGHAGLHSAGASTRRRHAMSLGITVAPEAQGQGVGTALMAALCDYADNWLACLRIELTVFTDNEIAQRLYRNFGFELEGTMRGYALRDGVYVDAYAMARLHPNPPTAPRPATAA